VPCGVFVPSSGAARHLRYETLRAAQPTCFFLSPNQLFFLYLSPNQLLFLYLSPNPLLFLQVLRDSFLGLADGRRAAVRQAPGSAMR
jgi:hypothetical protein